jgi:hypothetical protein
MTWRPIITRRRLLLAGLWLAGSSAARAQVSRGGDHGIGGTGISGGHDQGMGGTGIVGVIQRFGSIFVNGERISYAPNVPVYIDGEPASAKALRIGHLARVVALRQANGTLTTNRIEAVSEVMGPIETVRSGEMAVLGQKVMWAGRESWQHPGTHVAVFGLRRTDGVIVASLVQQRHDTATRVSGLLERDREGLRIGNLRLAGVDPALVGRRVQAEGHVAQDAMQVTHAKADDFSDLSGANRLSIEAYVRRVGPNLQFGSGYVARDASRFAPSGDARVVVNAVLDNLRGLQVESVQSVSRFPGASVERPWRRRQYARRAGSKSGEWACEWPFERSRQRSGEWVCARPWRSVRTRQPRSLRSRRLWRPRRPRRRHGRRNGRWPALIGAALKRQPIAGRRFQSGRGRARFAAGYQPALSRTPARRNFCGSTASPSIRVS